MARADGERSDAEGPLGAGEDVHAGVPDARLADWRNVSADLAEHFFRVGKASRYGDRIFLVNAGGVPTLKSIRKRLPSPGMLATRRRSPPMARAS